ncbi:MAG: hypothetical protein IJE77_09485 [Thermoguttaceae bacterium]|nr:hypothetical protein [Thermoguttaceae bacterium]MBQ9798598.1 hypothetical protein [Thermoguttaceae bacterium]
MFSFERNPDRRRLPVDDGDGGALVAVRVPLSAEAVERRRTVSTVKIKSSFRLTGYPSFPKEQEAQNAKTTYILITY